MFLFLGTQEVGNLNKSKMSKCYSMGGLRSPKERHILFAPFPPDKLYFFLIPLV